MTSPTAAAQERLRAVTDVLVAEVRDGAGRHEYDGVVPDLSPGAVRAGLARLGGAELPDAHDERHLAAAERRLRLELGEVQLHRRSPRPLLAALDLSVYDRPYAPPGERAEARARHLAGWPAAIDAALTSLDLVPAAAAEALLPAVRGAAAVVRAGEPHGGAALAAHARLLTHLERCTGTGDPDPALGAPGLTALLEAVEGGDVDLPSVAAAADAERRRLRDLLDAAADRIAPGTAADDVVARLVRDHPGPAGVLDEARRLTGEVVAFVRERGLLEHLDGECRVEASPPSRRWATAMLSWAGPYEPDAPSTYGITPPDPSWPPQRQDQWLTAFSRTTLPATTAHEVAPGHFAHGRALRRVRGDVRRTLHSPAFVEGWAHYAEELMVEEGFRGEDPRFAIGVAMKALLRVTRVRAAIGVHTRQLTVDEAAGLFAREAFLQGPAARGEALRAVIDPTYGRYTTGKLALRALRERARERWGPGFSPRRFHRAVLALGAPPPALLDTALVDTALEEDRA
ncbi:DUF885 family protein [Trujillonella humicola]|uniref:DUF885 family protein n=1 Tax=Trujillonella humicola TaxID=3383699 RepID=UPI003906BC0F